MLQNAYLLAKIGADTAENERHFAEKLPKIGNYTTGRIQDAPCWRTALWGITTCPKAKGQFRAYVCPRLNLRISQITQKSCGRLPSRGARTL